MALTALNTIKNWFKTNLIPTQQQFWDTFDSFRHKSDKVAATDVDGLNTLLAAKASNMAFQTHLTADNAHAALFGDLRDWVETQIAAVAIDSQNLGALTPASVIPDSVNVHGFAVQAGTYANCGGVVVPANSFGFVSRVLGVWGITITELDLAGKVNVSDIIDSVNSTATDKVASANSVRTVKELVEKSAKYTGAGANKIIGSTNPNANETSVAHRFFLINDLTADSNSRVKKININHGSVGVGVVFYIIVASIESGVLTIKEKIKLTTTGTNSIQSYVVDFEMITGDKIGISTQNKISKYEDYTGTGYFNVYTDYSLGDNSSSLLNFGISIEVEEIEQINLNSKISENSEKNRDSIIYNFSQDLTLATSFLATETQAFFNQKWISYTDAVRLKVHKSGDNLVKFYKVKHGNNSYSLIETLDISKYKEGEIVVIKFKNQITFEKGEYLAISSNLYYRDAGGENAIRLDGIGTTPVMIDDNNNGIDIAFQLLKLPTKTVDNNKINLIGKKFSILGDSISTFEGFIPSENDKFYPITWNPSFDVLSVEDTWWKKLIKETGLVLDVNNSWSGSRVTEGANLNNEGIQRKAFVTDDRMNNLGNPDYLLVFGGTNDYGNYSIPFGTIENNPSNWDLGIITHAYQYLVYEAQKKYPTTKIICCSPIQRGIFAETGYHPVHRWNKDLYLYQLANRIEAIAKMYGCEFVDLYASGITYLNSNDNPLEVGMTESLYLSDGLHPNEAGMELIKSKILEKIQ